MTEIKIKELKNYNLHPSIVSGGFGLCGYDRENGGYIYLNQGYGNMETYVTAESLVDMLEKDGFDTDELINIELKDGKIFYTHFCI